MVVDVSDANDVRAPQRGDLLAGRYRLTAALHETDEYGHSEWLGTDEMLGRDVAVEIQVPGGPAATALIDSAVTAGSVGHPSVVGVYDAVNDDTCAYVIREWVEAKSLTELLSGGNLSPTQAAIVLRNVADAVAAIHAAGHTHGRLNPDVVMIRDDNDVTLVGLTLDAHATQEHDIRALGGLLYATLTGQWPRQLGEHPRLPPAAEVSGMLCSPRQIRAGIPAYLDALATDLLDPSVATPTAAELAAELHRYDVTDPHLSALTAFEPEPPARRPWWKKAIIPIAAVLVIGTAGVVYGTRGLPDFGAGTYPESDDPTQQETSAEAAPLPLTNAVILDPDGDGTELDNAHFTIDGDPSTAWSPDAYSRPNFGGLKGGMGVLVSTETLSEIHSVHAQLSKPGTTVELYTAAALDPHNAQKEQFALAAPRVGKAGDKLTFILDNPVSARHILLWITQLPRAENGKFGYTIGVQEIGVSGLLIKN